jgi:phage shock protein A
VIEEQLTVLHEEISQLQQKLDDAKAKQQSLLAREKTSRARMDIRRSSNRDKLEEAFQKFDAYERKMDNLEAQVEAQDLGRSRTLHDEFNELARDDKVESELEALKASMTKPDQTKQRSES